MRPSHNCTLQSRLNLGDGGETGADGPAKDRPRTAQPCRDHPNRRPSHVPRLDTWTGLRAWFASLVARQQEQGFRSCPLGSLVAELPVEDDHLRDVIAAAFARWENELTLAFAGMRDTGRLAPSASPDELARHVLSAIQGGYLLSTIHRDPAPMREALHAAYEHLRQIR